MMMNDIGLGVLAAILVIGIIIIIKCARRDARQRKRWERKL